MEKVTFYGEIEGISLEQMVRYGRFSMRVKHFHSQYEIFCIIKGECLFFFNNREHVACSGDLILVDTNLIHITKSVTAEDMGHSRAILYASYDRMKAFDGQYPSLQLARFFRGHYGVYHLDKEQQALFLSLYRNLRIAMTEGAHNYRVGVGFKTLTWLFEITSYMPRQEGADPHFLGHSKYCTTYAIADYLSGNREQNVSLDELATHFYLSKYYVYRTFKGATGYTVTEYTDIYRIRKAKRPLDEADMSISRVAHGLSYEDLTYFEWMFKSFMAISPLECCKTLNTVTCTNEQITEFEEDMEQFSSHRQPCIYRNSI